jgi:hypothetical protein
MPEDHRNLYPNWCYALADAYDADLRIGAVIA